MLLEIKQTVGSPVPWKHKNSINTGLGAQLECLLSLDTWPVAELVTASCSQPSQATDRAGRADVSSAASHRANVLS